MSFKESGVDRRQFGRRDTYIRGWLQVNGRPKSACIIRNLSPKGALLEMAVPSWLPFKFELRIEGTGESFTCEVRHVLPSGVGVNFVAAEQALQMPVGAVDVVDEWVGLQSGRRKGHAPVQTTSDLRKKLFKKTNV